MTSVSSSKKASAAGSSPSLISIFSNRRLLHSPLLRQERPLIPRSLAALEQRLDSAVFFRASRHIVNLKWIASVEPAIAGGLAIKLKTGIEIEISRRQSLRFRELHSL
jgi:DNA-binding LytR/AlgR family response regulator